VGIESFSSHMTPISAAIKPNWYLICCSFKVASIDSYVYFQLGWGLSYSWINAFKL